MPAMPRPFVIGLTGGIASGKSTIALRLADELGTLLECDKLGWRAYDPKDGKEDCREPLSYTSSCFPHLFLRFAPFPIGRQRSPRAADERCSASVFLMFPYVFLRLSLGFP